MKFRIFYFSIILCVSCNPVKEDVWLLGFEKPSENPILIADSSYVFSGPLQNREVQWQKADVFNPAAIVRNDSIYLLFRAEDNPKAQLGDRTSRIGLAVSTDGIHFDIFSKPILYPDSGEFKQWDWPGGCEDPRIVQTEDGTYVLTYTSWNKMIARLSVATSPDIINWEKHGPVFEEAYDGKFLNNWTKSGSIVAKMENNGLVAAKINDKYWMYFGEQYVHIAYSENLKDWYPLMDEREELLRVMEPRAKRFDSKLTEPGPPAILTEDGILLFYNGKNDEGDNGDPSIPAGTYCGGQALFDSNDPAKLLNRLDTPFIRPSLPHELTGQYEAGTTFIEGLVYYKERWFLYYGTADSMVGLAIKED